MRYLPLTEKGKEKILAKCGFSSFKELTKQVPDALRLDRLLDIEPSLSEHELIAHLQGLASKNAAAQMHSFLGQGVYDHTWPSAIDYLCSRGEFLTAYTPYQPEVSQGTLQSLFEYQSLISTITGFEVSNGSMYDGPSSAVEAVLMAARMQRKANGKVLISAGTFKETKSLLKTYLEPLGFELVEWHVDDHKLVSLSDSSSVPDDSEDFVATLLQSPNKWGLIESWAELEKVSKKLNTKSIAYIGHIHSCAVLDIPGDHDIDIAIADGQPLGIPVGFGGPHLGIFCCKKKDVRQMPGRLVGATLDSSGNRAFCVTLATREQHIRREKATSNICSNQSLMALRAAMYTHLMGPTGLKKVAQLSHAKCEYFKASLKSILDGIEGIDISPGNSFNEFSILSSQKKSLWIEEAIKACEEKGFILGKQIHVPMSTGYTKAIAIATTEKSTKGHIDQVVEILKQSLESYK